ncbi:unnamed protein product [Paramecium octaurelia]|uniref:Uncharacterized protein n=1 Tax=Paramecium octaurelia TaxID=43137 RepID=A0A8S1TF65_PAROT|nr:unnamed protein product [Paramecium octaurelia]CAD8152721.1 unnamed protein product [Paramecium octaurelia]
MLKHTIIEIQEDANQGYSKAVKIEPKLEEEDAFIDIGLSMMLTRDQKSLIQRMQLQIIIFFMRIHNEFLNFRFPKICI